MKVGVNQGQRVPNELADLFEGVSPIRSQKIDLSKPKRDVDVLVIGGGGGGVSAALFAAELGARTLITTKLRFGDSNTLMAEGGIQAAVGKMTLRPFIISIPWVEEVSRIFPILVHALVSRCPHDP